MRPLRSSLVLVTCLLTAACAGTGTSATGREHMRTPTPSQQVIEAVGYDEAVRLAGGYALGTGNLLRVVRAEQENGRWKVRVDVQSLNVPRRAYLELDASTGELLELRTEPLPTEE